MNVLVNIFFSESILSQVRFCSCEYTRTLCISSVQTLEGQAKTKILTNLYLRTESRSHRSLSPHCSLLGNATTQFIVDFRFSPGKTLSKFHGNICAAPAHLMSVVIVLLDVQSRGMKLLIIVYCPWKMLPLKHFVHRLPFECHFSVAGPA